MTLNTQEAIAKIDKMKQGLMNVNDKVYLLNDMLISFSWNDKFMVNVYFSINIIDLESGLSAAATSVLDSRLKFGNDAKLAILSKHYLYEPDAGAIMEKECKEMKNMSIRMEKLLHKRLDQLQVVVMNDYNSLTDEYDDDLPIYFYAMVNKARAKN